MKGISSEMKVSVAALFLGAGKQELTVDEAIKSISMDRRWFFPDLARAYLDNAVSMGYIIRDGDFLRPSFDVSEIEVPFGYIPDPSLLSPPEESAPKTEESSSPPDTGKEYPFVDELISLLRQIEAGKVMDLDAELDSIERKLTG